MSEQQVEGVKRTKVTEEEFEALRRAMRRTKSERTVVAICIRRLLGQGFGRPVGEEESRSKEAT